jgi:hypothetical protein
LPPSPAVATPAPLSLGPLPLSRTAAWLWAVAILVSTLFLGFGLTMVASRVAETTVPPGAVTFGSAAVLPAPGWTLVEQTATSVVLEDKGVWVRFRSVSAEGASAAVRAQDLADRMMREFPPLTAASQPYDFWTPTGAQGQLIAVAGANNTAIVASVVDGGQAVDVESLGESTQFGEAITDIESMIESIRVQVPYA